MLKLTPVQYTYMRRAHNLTIVTADDDYVLVRINK